MNEFFDAIGNFISACIDYCVNSTNVFLNVLGIIGKASTYVLMLSQFMPAPIRFIILVLVSYCIIVNVLKLGG